MRLESALNKIADSHQFTLFSMKPGYGIAFRVLPSEQSSPKRLIGMLETQPSSETTPANTYPISLIALFPKTEKYPYNHVRQRAECIHTDP